MPRKQVNLKTTDPHSPVNLLDEMEGQFGALLIDPPWRFVNRTGKMAPEHKRLRRYGTMSFSEIASLSVGRLGLPRSHLYLWTPNALIEEALQIMRQWGFAYKTNIVWYKVRKDGGPDGRGVGFYFRNVTELLLFGIKGSLRTLQPGRRQVNVVVTRKQEHSRKPGQVYDIIERCSPGPFLELFARERREGWTQWGDELESYETTRPIYKADTREFCNGEHDSGRRGRKGNRPDDRIGGGLSPCEPANLRQTPLS
jgi:N6-adenosine-specific RNA methylase IME4